MENRQVNYCSLLYDGVMKIPLQIKLLNILLIMLILPKIIQPD